MPQDNTHDNELDVPGSELMSQDEAGESQSDGNSLLTAMGGGSTEDEFEGDDSSTQSGSKLTPRVAIVAGILVVGGGMIFGMRHYEMKQGMDMEFLVADTNAAATAQVTPLTKAQESVLNQLRVGAGDVVAAPDLARNPLLLANQDEPKVDDKPVVPTGPNIEELTRRYTQLCEAMNVTSIVPSGNVPVAVIDKRAVVVGNTVGKYFVINEIAVDAVTHNMYVKVELVGFDSAVDGAQMFLHMRSGR